jgi:hypothetical protein
VRVGNMPKETKSGLHIQRHCSKSRKHNERGVERVACHREGMKNLKLVRGRRRKTSELGVGG